MMVMGRDDGRDPIFKVHFRSHRCDAWVAVNAYYSQPPMQGQAVANSKVKVTIYDHQPTAVRDTLARVDSFSFTQCGISTFKRLFCKI